MGKRLWVERNKDGSWDAFSEDGAHIKFGKGRGQFTPGDLMKVALAGCAALSSQFAVEHTLGDGKGAKIVVDGTYDADTDAYIGFDEQVVIDATDAGLSDEDAEKLAEMVRAIAEPEELIISMHEPFTGIHVGPGMLSLFFIGAGR